MFVRKKNIKGRAYYYLVKSIRSGDTVKQVVVEYLGTKPPTTKSIKVKYKKK